MLAIAYQEKKPTKHEPKRNDVKWSFKTCNNSRIMAIIFFKGPRNSRKFEDDDYFNFDRIEQYSIRPRWAVSGNIYLFTPKLKRTMIGIWQGRALRALEGWKECKKFDSLVFLSILVIITPHVYSSRRRHHFSSQLLGDVHRPEQAPIVRQNS